MNVNMLIQGLAADMAQIAQNGALTEPGQEGTEFEVLLREQSKNASSQKKEETGKDQKTGKKDEAPEKQEASEPTKNSTKDEEIPAEGYEVAAAMVTSQPVVPFELLAPAAVESAEEVTVIAEPAAMESILPEQPAETGAQMADSMPEPVNEEQNPSQETIQGQAPGQELQGEVKPEAEAPEIRTEAPRQEAQPELNGQQAGRAQTAEPQVKAEAKPQGEKDPEAVDVWQQSQPVFHQVKAAPVKVAENYQPVEPQDQEVLTQVRDQLSQAIQQGASVVEFQMEPANLGKVLVEITRGADGSLAVMLTAATEKTANILQRHSAGLQEMMTVHTQNPVQIEVQQPRESEHDSQFLNPDGHNQRQEQQKQQQNRRHQNNTSDFLQQLRLGLIGLEGE